MPSNTPKFLTSAARIANVVFVGAGVVCLLILFYFAYYYAWTGQRQFTSWTGVAINYLVPLLMAAASFLCLRLQPAHKINVALLICVAGTGVVLLETVLTLWINLPSVSANLDQSALKNKRMEAAKAAGIVFDPRTKSDVVNDLRREGVDAVPSIFPQGLLTKQEDGTLKSAVSSGGSEILPLAGVANKVAVVCNEGGNWITHKSDEHGFNNPQRLWDMPSFSVAAVGDSFVQVWCVPPDKTFVGLIRNRYSSTLNLGMEGNGPLAMLATIKEYAQVAKPKAVLWFYCEGNDLSDLISEERSPLLRRYMNAEFTQDLFKRQAEIDKAILDFIASAGEKSDGSKLKELSALLTNAGKMPDLLGGVMKFSQLRERLGLLQGKESQAPPATNSGQERARRMAPTVQLFEQILSEAKTTVGRWGGTLYFVYLPGWHRYAPGQDANPDRDSVLRAAQNVGLSVIDIHELFMAQKDPLHLFPFGLQGHYNEEGDRLVAERVLGAISVE